MQFLIFPDWNNLFTIIIFNTVAILFVVILCLIFIFLLAIRRHANNFKAISSEKTNQDHALFVDLSPKASDVVELAIEVWRINNRINKASNSFTDIQKRGLESSIKKFLKFLDSYKIKIIDHTGEKYNEGMNIDVVSFEKDDSVRFPVVKETIEPSILCDDHIIKKGKIIVINK
jgi:hypothetical protein